ncbi:Adenylate cyclase CyaB [bioreactor metagenome]|uniref:Adenylate cyclase CyaB n=1 Tax=bioreactor metagenome TaxID=1076179 RepID=A0A644T4Z7_9ZZZZ|nr:class IV adenylate cyclase [Methanobrevibacter sp.]MEA4957801.1 class IV adenylate cyclase [Methanobrevibacter sp.]
MIEVEVKAKIDNFDSIEKGLKKIGAKKTHVEHQEDLYFNSPIKDFAKTDEALRIRKVNIEDSFETYITYKGPKIDEKSKTRKEIEVKIEDSEKVSNIFKSLEFVETSKVVKNRTIYLLEQYIISLDNVIGLGPYMEIETDIDEGCDYESEIDKIFDIFKKLDIISGFERTSYLELLEKEKN